MIDRESNAGGTDPMLPLFAYGTLRDPDYQRELFGRTYHMHRARVADYRITATPTGYLAAAPQSGAVIDGAIVEIDERGLIIADAWEDLDIYERIEIDAYRLDGRVERCFIYVIAAADGPPVWDTRLADRSRAEIIADIRRFRTSLGDRPEP